MGREVEPHIPADLQPMYGPQPNAGFSYTGTEKPEWLDWKTPETPGDGILARMDRGWSYGIRWLRALAIGFLLVTFRWYYTAALLVTIILLVLLLTASK